jgi:hypothetical protein
VVPVFEAPELVEFVGAFPLPFAVAFTVLVP